MNRCLQVLSAMMLLVVAQSVLLGAKTTDAAGKLLTSEVLLCKIPPEVPLDDIVAAEDCSRVAFPATRNGSQCMVMDGVKGAAYYDVSTAFVSSTGLVVYAAERDHQNLIVINGKEYGPYQGLSEDSPPLFSPDGKHVAYSAQRRGRWFMVADGIEGKDYDSILDWTIRFSPDSKHIAYTAIRDRKQVIMVDGVERGECEEADEHDVEEVVFSPDSTRVAWRVGPRGRQAAAVDGVKGHDYERVGDIRFSPNSRRVAYAAGERSGGAEICHLVLDGKEVETCARIDPFVFSPDSRRLAYRAIRGRQHYVVADGVETECGGIVDDIIEFSPDSKRLAYVAATDHGRVVVVDGVKDREYETADALRFSPDSKRVAYAAYREGRRFVVTNGAEGNGYDEILSQILFSRDSAHVAYVASRGGKRCVVVDGVEGEIFDAVNPLSMMFGPDSRHLVYVAQRNGKQFVMADEAPGAAYDAFLPYGRVAFEAANTIRALARRGDELLRVRITIAKD